MQERTVRVGALAFDIIEKAPAKLFGRRNSHHGRQGQLTARGQRRTTAQTARDAIIGDCALRHGMFKREKQIGRRHRGALRDAGHFRRLRIQMNQRERVKMQFPAGRQQRDALDDIIRFIPKSRFPHHRKGLVRGL